MRMKQMQTQFMNDGNEPNESQMTSNKKCSKKKNKNFLKMF
jgi:hypothetical protein